FVTLWAWLYCCPCTVPLPQMSHCLAIAAVLSFRRVGSGGPAKPPVTRGQRVAEGALPGQGRTLPEAAKPCRMCGVPQFTGAPDSLTPSLGYCYAPEKFQLSEANCH